MTCRWVGIRKGIVDAHVFEEPPDVAMEETLDLLIVEFRIDEYGT